MPAGRGPASVEFDNVTFTYPERHIPVLKGVNLKVCVQLSNASTGIFEINVLTIFRSDLVNSQHSLARPDLENRQ